MAGRERSSSQTGASPSGSGNSHRLAPLKPWKEPSERVGEREGQHRMLPAAARAWWSHTLCSGHTGESCAEDACFHTVTGGSSLINLKAMETFDRILRKKFPCTCLTSRDSRQLYSQTVSETESVNRANGQLWQSPIKLGSRGRHRSSFHLFPNAAFWVRRSHSRFIRSVSFSPLPITTTCEWAQATPSPCCRSSLGCGCCSPDFLRNWIRKTIPWP